MRAYVKTVRELLMVGESEWEGRPVCLTWRHKKVPIYLAASGPKMLQLAGEIADGVIGHPIWSIQWATKKVPEQLKVGLDRGGRERSDIHVNHWFWVTPNRDPIQSVEDARACVAFYAGIEQYEAYFAAHGFRDEQSPPG